jgi:hypothetical protein
MKETDGGDSGKLPLRRERVTVEDKSTKAEPLPLKPEETKRIGGFLEFIQARLDKYGSSVSDGVIRLTGFGGFSFQSTLIREGLGIPKTEISIWYHPLRTRPSEGYQSISVLDAIFEGESYSGQTWEKGKEFHLYQSWQQELLNLIEDPVDAERDFEKRSKIKASRQILPVDHPLIEGQRQERGQELKRKLSISR